MTDKEFLEDVYEDMLGVWADLASSGVGGEEALCYWGAIVNDYRIQIDQMFP